MDPDDELLDLETADEVHVIVLYNSRGVQPIFWPMRTEYTRQATIWTKGKLYSLSPRGDH